MHHPITYIRLDLRNFRQFLHAQSVDLAPLPGRPIIEIVGPTASGKSTLVEALAWALSGDKALRRTVPASDDPRTNCEATAEDGPTDARVTLRDGSGERRVGHENPSVPSWIAPLLFDSEARLRVLDDASDYLDHLDPDSRAAVPGLFDEMRARQEIPAGDRHALSMAEIERAGLAYSWAITRASGLRFPFVLDDALETHDAAGRRIVVEGLLAREHQAILLTRHHIPEAEPWIARRLEIGSSEFIAMSTVYNAEE